MIHGLFMEAMRWDDETMTVVDSLPGEMNPVSSTMTAIPLECAALVVEYASLKYLLVECCRE